MKRMFDVLASCCGLVVLAPLLGVIAAAIRLASPGPVLFRQERMGRGFKPFSIYKFRTMVVDAHLKGGLLTAGEDPRITRVGRWLRGSKLDELPQLLNVLLGDMSLVGPRPEVRKYVELFRDHYETILRVRPGITDWASFQYRDESAILAQAVDPEEEYLHRILPDKLRLAEEYVRHSSVRLDLVLIFLTLAKLLPWKGVDRFIRPGACPSNPKIRMGGGSLRP
jgi:lipopolysaccharide/colanic/teichoic acid biosynthesis glycosyltransferase